MNLKNSLIAVMWLSAWTMSAQVDNGPAPVNRGASGIGSRGGQQLELRYFANVSGVYDDNLQPLAQDSKGNLVRVNSLYGVEVALGAYGAHKWRTTTLGLDYRGAYRKYNASTYFDGTDQTLSLGLTYQKSRRLIFDFRETGGTVAYGTSDLYGGGTAQSDAVVTQPSSYLFDNRSYFFNSSADVSIVASARTIYTIGGQGYLLRRQSAALVGMNGYNFRGTVQHRTSRDRSIGVTYNYNHFGYPDVFGGSYIHRVEGFFATNFGRRWAFAVQGGFFISEVEGERVLRLDPAIAALLGRSTVVFPYYNRSTFPSGSVTLTRQFQTAQFSVNYTRSISPGNGVYLTSRSEGLSANLSYTGFRKFAVSAGAGYGSLADLGSSTGASTAIYRTVNGGAGLTYRIKGSTYLSLRYDARHQEIDSGGYARTGSRASIGLAFSPGAIPLSLW